MVPPHARRSTFHPDTSTTPEEFAETVIAENSNVCDATANLPSNLNLIETAGDLISRLMPTESDYR